MSRYVLVKVPAETISTNWKEIGPRLLEATPEYAMDGATTRRLILQSIQHNYLQIWALMRVSDHDEENYAVKIAAFIGTRILTDKIANVRNLHITHLVLNESLNTSAFDEIYAKLVVYAKGMDCRHMTTVTNSSAVVQAAKRIGAHDLILLTKDLKDA